jgi:hypothetical protein
MFRIVLVSFLLLSAACAGAAVPVTPVVPPDSHSPVAGSREKAIPELASPTTVEQPSTRRPAQASGPGATEPAGAQFVDAEPGVTIREGGSTQSPVATPTTAPLPVNSDPAANTSQSLTKRATSIQPQATTQSTATPPGTGQVSPTPLPENTPVPSVSPLDTGPQAPHFTLPSADGRVIESESYLGQKNILLVFYRAFW